MAKLYFRYGTVNSGKSTALLQVAHNYEERGMSVLVLKPRIDTKGKQTVVSRIGSSRPVDILIDETDNLTKILKTENESCKVSCILIDEVQFLSDVQIEQLLDVAVLQDVPVICYGLRTDFQTKAFPGAARLLQIAHSLEELKTICRCGKKALLNGRKVNGIFTASGDQVAIDGENQVDYEALCGKCYIKLVGPVSTK